VVIPDCLALFSTGVLLKAPIHRLKKNELVWLATHYCRHGHNFLSHYNCYEAKEEKIGFLDIETTNLQADFGFILSYCIKDSTSDEILYRTITKAEIEKAKRGDEDKEVVRQLIKDMEKFDRVVTYYGKRFDIPFIRTRALSMGLEFPPYGAQKHTDLYFTAKHKLKLSSNRLENVCRTILNKTQKTRVEGRYWRAASRGDEASIEYILDHNKKDVLDLEKIYNRLVGFGRQVDTSI
jgi:uncharacterized protein YprB with RNaseH-like and TPR domain